jgi:hypothetical protein
MKDPCGHLVFRYHRASSRRVRLGRSVLQWCGYSERKNGHAVQSEKVRLSLDAHGPICDREVHSKACGHGGSFGSRGEEEEQNPRLPQSLESEVALLS